MTLTFQVKQLISSSSSHHHYFASDNIQPVKEKIEFWKTQFCHCKFDSFLVLFLMSLLVILMCYFLILYYEAYQHLEDMNNSVKEYFANDQCMMLQNCTWQKSHSKHISNILFCYKHFILLQQKPMFRFIETVSNSALQLTIKELPLVKFGCNIKEHE